MNFSCLKHNGNSGIIFLNAEDYLPVIGPSSTLFIVARRRSIFLDDDGIQNYRRRIIFRKCIFF